MRSFPSLFKCYFGALILGLVALLWAVRAGGLVTGAYLLGPLLIQTGLLLSGPDFWRTMRELLEPFGRWFGWFMAVAYGLLAGCSYLLPAGSPAVRALSMASSLLFFTGALTLVLLVFTLAGTLWDRAAGEGPQ